VLGDNPRDRIPQKPGAGPKRKNVLEKLFKIL
jgi:hypothetical protein